MVASLGQLQDGIVTDPILSSKEIVAAQYPPENRKMNTNPEKESAQNKPEDIEIKIVPEGTFAGHIDKPEIVKKGEVIPEDTGDQGGGQN
jgi:hypothetical protein